MKACGQNSKIASFRFLMIQNETIQEHKFWWSTKVYDDKGYNNLLNYSQPKYRRKAL